MNHSIYQNYKNEHTEIKYLKIYKKTQTSNDEEQLFRMRKRF